MLVIFLSNMGSWDTNLRLNVWNDHWCYEKRILIVSSMMRKVFKGCFWMFFVEFNPCQFIGLFLYPQKTSENQRFSDVFRRIERDQRHAMGQLEQIFHIGCMVFVCLTLLHTSINISMKSYCLTEWNVLILEKYVM